MPRLRQIPRSEVTSEVVLENYKRLFGDRDPVKQPGTKTGTPGNWWTVFAQVPDAFDHAVRGFAFYLTQDRKLSPVLRELGQTRAGWLTGSQFVYSQHCKSCRNAGIPEEKITAIRDWQVAGCFDEKERALLAYTDALVLMNGRVSDGIFAKLKQHLSETEILEFTYITCMYHMHAIMSRALRLEYDDKDDPVVEIAAPAGYQGGNFMNTSGR